jgi:hypothetical protein
LGGSRSRSSHRSRVHVVVVVMMMMVMDVMMMMMMARAGHWRLMVDGSGPGGGASGCFLGDGIAGEAERENGRGRKGLDHGRAFLWLGNPKGSQRSIRVAA